MSQQRKVLKAIERQQTKKPPTYVRLDWDTGTFPIGKPTRPTKKIVNVIPPKADWKPKVVVRTPSGAVVEKR